MITERFLEEYDFPLLEMSLADDEFHQDTKPDFFTAPGTLTKVYETDDKVTCFVRGSVALRLDIQWTNNKDGKTNMRVMLECFPQLVEQAKAQGFTEITFQSDNELLRRFCIKRLGFRASGNELRKDI